MPVFLAPDQVARVQLALAAIGLALFLFPRWRWRDPALAVLALVSLAAYGNFGAGHGGRFIHTWDQFHYYVGSKYSPELGYERLYECTAVADAEAGLRGIVARRTMTDLQTNTVVPGYEILLNPERCTRHFSAERWAAFKADVGWFRAHSSRSLWAQTQRDHGYNATPLWNAIGGAIASLAPASDGSILLLALFDPLLLFAALLLLAWAFGWRVSALAAIVLGTYAPSEFGWNGGAFLRMDWLFCVIACVACLRRERPFVAGVALALAAGLRLFPLALFAGPLIGMAARRWKGLPIGSTYRRLSGGVGLGCVLVLAAPLLSPAGAEVYSAFVQNTLKHAGTPLTNHMGLRTLVAYRPGSVAARLEERGAVDGFRRFREARLANAQEARPLQIGVGLAFLGLLVLALRKSAQPWQAALLGLVLVPLGLELTCYYFVFAIALAALAERRPAAGAVLLAMVTVSAALHAKVLTFGEGGADERYVALSAVLLLGFAGLLALFAAREVAYFAPPSCQARDERSG